MTVQQLLEKFNDIKELARDIENNDSNTNEDIQNRIIAICEDVEIEHKIEMRLEK